MSEFNNCNKLLFLSFEREYVVNYNKSINAMINRGRKHTNIE
jgi:hypothetical protein